MLSMEKKESCLSQVIKIGRYLRNSRENDVASFLNHWRCELRNNNTLGELISFIIVKAHSKMFSEHEISNLLRYCESHPPKTTQSNYPCTKKNSLLSLPFDIFNQLGSFLDKQDDVNVGYCSHQLYNATQNIQFLKTSGFHSLVLNQKTMNQIIMFDANPWSWCAGCYKLMLHGNCNNKTLDDYLNKNDKSYWRYTLMSSIKELEVAGNGAKLLRLIDIETLFSLCNQSSNNNSSNYKTSYSGRSRLKERGSLCIKFDNVRSRTRREKGKRVLSDLTQFTIKYRSYFENKCDCNISQIRQIKSISIAETPRFRLNTIWNLLKSFQPNYKELIFEETKANIFSLNTLGKIFHKHLKTLELKDMDFDVSKILHQCLQAVNQCGKTLYINNSIIEDFLDETKVNEVKTLFLNSQENQNVVGGINNSLLTLDYSRLDQMIDIADCCEDERMIDDETTINVICLDILQSWLIRLMDNWAIVNVGKKDIIINGSDINKDNEDGDDDEDEDESDSNGSRSNSSTHNLKILESILIDNKPNIRSLKLVDGYGIISPYSFESDALLSLNTLCKFKVGYRLLNINNTVENLFVSFHVPIFSRNNTGVMSKFYTSWTKSFTLAMSNIVKMFDNLKCITIELQLGIDKSRIIEKSTEKIKTSETKIETETENEYLADVTFTIEEWIKRIQIEFKSNTKEMIEKFQKNDHNLFELRFRFKFGNLSCDNEIDMCDYIQSRIDDNKFDKNSTTSEKLRVIHWNEKELMNISDSVYEQVLHHSTPAVNGDIAKKKNNSLLCKLKQFCDYWDILTTMKTCVLSCINDCTQQVCDNLFVVEHCITMLIVSNCNELEVDV